MSTPANFNGKKPTIDPDDSAMLLIDIESYNKAQEVVAKHEVLESNR